MRNNKLWVDQTIPEIFQRDDSASRVPGKRDNLNCFSKLEGLLNGISTGAKNGSYEASSLRKVLDKEQLSDS